MRAAEGLLEVPPWKFLRGSPEDVAAGGNRSQKPYPSRVVPRAVVFATKVPEEELDPNEPWFIQDCIEAHAYHGRFVQGKLFSFELSRTFTDRSKDWRVVSLEPQFSHWASHRLPEEVGNAIHAYMARLSLDYGRLDFLRRSSGDYVFLEVNPHGEWGWLDPHGEEGVLKEIIEAVSPLTPVHPIPVTPFFSTRA